MPSERNDLTLVIRSSDEAEGERRMIGSGRRDEELDPDGFLGREVSPADGAGTGAPLLPGFVPGGY